MADSNRSVGQPKGSTKAEINLEQMARALLAAVLPRSIKEKIEYGAVICKNNRTDQLSATKLRSSTDSDNTVDVGLSEPNCGCPEGTSPVAFYHTHPFDKIDAGDQLGNRMLDLQAGIHFQEVERLVLSADELDRTG